MRAASAIVPRGAWSASARARHRLDARGGFERCAVDVDGPAREGAARRARDIDGRASRGDARRGSARGRVRRTSPRAGGRARRRGYFILLERSD